MFWFRKRNRNINPSKEVTVSRQRWMGLEPVSLLHQKNGTTVITARLVEKPVDYLNKVIPFQGRKYRVREVQWGGNGKFVGLIVE